MTPIYSSSVLRPQVEAFAHAMEQKLRLNDHKGGWLHMGNGTLMSRVQQELGELTEALERKDTPGIRDEAADAGNFLMMICQNNKALGPVANVAPCNVPLGVRVVA